MQKFIDKLIKFLLIILFLLLPLVNSHFFDLLGINYGLYVNGNYEFTKVIFFNILSSLIIFLFFIQNLFQKNPIKFPNILYFIIFLLIFSNIFSSQIFTSFFGNNSKPHSVLMFLNLIGLLIVLINLDKKFLQKLLFTTIISSIFVMIIGIKEYYFPTFNYGDLSNRISSTFGHPNYVALFLLMIVPFIPYGENKNFLSPPLLGGGWVGGFFSPGKKNWVGGIIFILLTLTLILTKSIWGIFVFFCYLIYKLFHYKPKLYEIIFGNSYIFLNKIFHFSKNKLLIFYFKLNKIHEKIGKSFLIIFSILLILILLLIIYKFSFYTKFSSFISRFYIWKTTLILIFSDFKNILIGSGLGTLEFNFDKFKSEYLYIYENIGFTADRSHNLFIELFYNFGILGFILGIYLFIKTIINYKKSEKEYYPYYESILLFFIFNFFNFPSISHYLILVLFLVIPLKSKNFLTPPLLGGGWVGGFIILSIFTITFSSIYYIEETKLYNNSNYISNYYFYYKLKSEDYKQNLIKNQNLNIKKRCEILTNFSPSVENYFYCGNILWDIDETIAKNYYKQGLKKLPDLRNKDSKYNQEFIIKNLINQNKFFADKYSNLREILERIK